MNYPKGIKNKILKDINYKNRGMTLENEINITNEYYKDKNIAYIYKKPTPIQVTKVDYKNSRNAIIREAYFKEPSTTDYNGIYKGKYIDFEAKETTSKTSFPLSNIHEHQIKHIENIVNANGIVFLIIRFTVLNKTFLLLGKDLINYIKTGKKKSINIEFLKKYAYQISDKYIPRVDYIEIINKIYGGSQDE